MSKGKAWTEQELAQLLELEDQRVPRRTMSRQLGRSIPAIVSQLSKRGLAKRRRPSGELRRLVKRYYCKGRSDTDLADIAGCRYYSAISNTRRMLGLPNGLTASERARIGALYRWAGNRKEDKAYD